MNFRISWCFISSPFYFKDSTHPSWHELNKFVRNLPTRVIPAWFDGAPQSLFWCQSMLGFVSLKVSPQMFSHHNQSWRLGLQVVLSKISGLTAANILWRLKKLWKTLSDHAEIAWVISTCTGLVHTTANHLQNKHVYILHVLASRPHTKQQF